MRIALVALALLGCGRIGYESELLIAAPEDVVELAAGSHHTCARRANGTVLCWGANAVGQLGDGTNTSRATPEPIEGMTDAIQLSAGYTHSCVLRSDRTVACWGSNDRGQLGREGDDGTTPMPVPGVDDARVVDCGTGFHTCAIVGDDGEVVCWGLNAFGQLGQPPMLEAPGPPMRVPGLRGAIALGVGVGHTCVTLGDHTVVCFGGNHAGQLGTGTLTPTSAPVAVLGIEHAEQLEAGTSHTCAIDDRLRCWGHNHTGQLGIGTYENRRVPTAVLDGVLRVAAGHAHTCAILEGGRAQCWGQNWAGQLGDGTRTDRATPGLVPDLEGVEELALGTDHTCARIGPEVLCWGANGDGRLGSMSMTQPVPTPVEGL